MTRYPTLFLGGAFAAAVLIAAAAFSVGSSAQSQILPGTERREWRYLGGDAGHTRFSPLDQVTPANFETLTEAWRFDPQRVVGPNPARGTPVYVGGKLLSVAGPHRHVVSIDPASGKLLWSFLEPQT